MSNSIRCPSQKPSPSQTTTKATLATWTCAPCGLNMMASSKESHLAGKKHIAKTRQLPAQQPMIGQSPPPLISGKEWKCVLCHVRTSEASWDEHIAGKKHQKHMKAATNKKHSNATAKKQYPLPNSTSSAHNHSSHSQYFARHKISDRSWVIPSFLPVNIDYWITRAIDSASPLVPRKTRLSRKLHSITFYAGGIHARWVESSADGCTGQNDNNMTNDMIGWDAPPPQAQQRINREIGNAHANRTRKWMCPVCNKQIDYSEQKAHITSMPHAAQLFKRRQTTTIFNRNGRSILLHTDGCIEMGDIRVRDVRFWGSGHARKVGAMQQVQGGTSRAVRRWRSRLSVQSFE